MVYVECICVVEIMGIVVFWIFLNIWKRMNIKF